MWVCPYKVSARDRPLASSMNETCTAPVFSSPDIHISSFWIRIKRQVRLMAFKSRNLYVKTPARAWIKCRGRIYILLKLILNIKNAANVVLHTAIKTTVLVLFRSCCLIGKSLKRVEVSCLFYVIWLKTIHTLNYYYYSIYIKSVECLKNNYHNTGKTGLYWFSSELYLSILFL